MGLFKRNPYRDKDQRGKSLGFQIHAKSDMEKYRADTFYTKEPETLVWIDSFKPDSIFIDVGANIGVYSLYCAMSKPRVQVYAFEPMLENYTRLVDNLLLNSAYNITPINMAMGKSLAMLPFYPVSLQVGASGGQIGQPVDEHGKKYAPVCERNVLTISYDRFFDMVPYKRNAYLKIDVDGRELDVIHGIVRHSPSLSGVLVEVNTAQVSISDITLIMKGYGLIPDSRINHMKPHSSDRRGGDPVNIVFTRPY